MGWFGLALAFLAFFLSHSLPVRPPLKPALERVLGPAGFGIAYSVLSIAVLAWLVVAAGNAPFVPVWNWAVWQNHVAMTLMLAVCILAALAIGRPNPFSFGGAHNDRFDPANPGIVRVTRHPLLAALGLWALAHLVANGDLAHVILFGTFAGFAMLGRRIVDKRKQRVMGDAWNSQLQQVAKQPLGRTIWKIIQTSWLRLFIGVAAYAALLALHPVVIGVNPMP